jgi:hypothetical protein
MEAIESRAAAVRRRATGLSVEPSAAGCKSRRLFRSRSIIGNYGQGQEKAALATAPKSGRKVTNEPMMGGVASTRSNPLHTGYQPAGEVGSALLRPRGRTKKAPVARGQGG